MSCQVLKPLDAFEMGGPRSKNLRKVCKLCRSRKKYERSALSSNLQSRRWRRQNRAAAVLLDCRSSDKKKGRLGNDLDLTTVATLLSQACSYCGSTELQMTLDRIDNTRAHTRANVLASCIRCNLIRGSMPYVAWTRFIPVIRETVAEGLFGNWRSKPIKLARDG